MARGRRVQNIRAIQAPGAAPLTRGERGSWKTGSSWRAHDCGAEDLVSDAPPSLRPQKTRSRTGASASPPALQRPPRASAVTRRGQRRQSVARGSSGPEMLDSTVASAAAWDGTLEPLRFEDWREVRGSRRPQRFGAAAAAGGARRVADQERYQQIPGEPLRRWTGNQGGYRCPFDRYEHQPQRRRVLRDSMSGVCVAPLGGHRAGAACSTPKGAQQDVAHGVVPTPTHSVSTRAPACARGEARGGRCRHTSLETTQRLRPRGVVGEVWTECSARFGRRSHGLSCNHRCPQGQRACPDRG
jgi:hypothetical protein